MRQVLYQLRITSAQIPANHPKVRNPWRQIKRRNPARVPHRPRRKDSPNHSPSRAYLRIEDFLDLRLSRFSNPAAHASL
jgi:hypothetical protein